MRRYVLLAVVVCVAAVGCGDGNKTPPPLTDEQKKAIQEEDKRIADEEGGPQKVVKPKGKK